MVDSLTPKLTRLTREMIRIPSPNPPGGEERISSYVQTQLDALGFKTQIVEPKQGRCNTLGVLPGSGDGRSLVYNGHMDTVPVGNLDNWTVDPLAADLKDGVIYGRGSGDMKGSIACAIVAAEALQKSGVELKGNLHIHAVADEEYFSRYGTRYLCENGYLEGVDMAIVGEGSTRDGRVMARPAVRGRTLVDIKVKGRSAHSSRPQAGINAVLKMSRILTAIDETPFSYPTHPILPAPSIAPGTMIKGGTKDNMIPEECTSVTDVRTVPGMTPEGVLADVQGVVDALKAMDPELDAEVYSSLSMPPSEIPVTHPLYMAADRATRKIVGYPLEPVGASGSNDTSFITNFAKVPSMAFGPGGGNAHAPDEYTTVEMLAAFAKIYALMFVDLLG